MNPEDKAKIDEEVNNLKSSIESVLGEIQTEENKFSLFGWAKKMFIK